MLILFLSNVNNNENILKIPIGVSMAVTFVSSLTVLGYPVLSYNHGSVILWMSVASILQFLPCYFYYIPFLHRCKLASAYHVRMLVNFSLVTHIVR